MEYNKDSKKQSKNIEGEAKGEIIEIIGNDKLQKRLSPKSQKKQKSINKALAGYIEIAGETHKRTNDMYMTSLDRRLNILYEQEANAKTQSEKDAIRNEIMLIIEKQQDENNASRNLYKYIPNIIVGVGTALFGSAVVIIKKNPEVLRKGLAMFAQPTIKRIR